MKRYFSIKPLRLLFLSLLFIVSASTFSSCVSEDEPDTGIDYYLSIEPRTSIRYTIDPRANMMGQVTDRMKDAIHKAYPVRNLYGDDTAVIQACNEAYSYYREAYPGGAQCTQCVVKLYRARMQGIVVKQSVALKSYNM